MNLILKNKKILSSLIIFNLSITLILCLTIFLTKTISNENDYQSAIKNNQPWQLVWSEDFNNSKNIPLSNRWLLIENFQINNDLNSAHGFLHLNSLKTFALRQKPASILNTKNNNSNFKLALTNWIIEPKFEYNLTIRLRLAYGAGKKQFFAFVSPEDLQSQTSQTTNVVYISLIDFYESCFSNPSMRAALAEIIYRSAGKTPAVVSEIFENLRLNTVSQCISMTNGLNNVLGISQVITNKNHNKHKKQMLQNLVSNKFGENFWQEFHTYWVVLGWDKIIFGIDHFTTQQISMEISFENATQTQPHLSSLEKEMIPTQQMIDSYRSKKLLALTIGGVVINETIKNISPNNKKEMIEIDYVRLFKRYFY